MDGSMAEGISTSPQTCPLAQSHDLQGLYASEGLPSPPSSCHLHVNDLGLTPSPGSQQQQQQQKPADATHVSPRDKEHGWSDEGAVGEKSATKEPQEQTEGLSIETGEALYDPLFDSDFGLQDLESAFLSHKRAHDEAFPEDFGFEESPEKRRNQNLSIPTNTLPDETPSLSPDSSHKLDQAETALNTPSGIERPPTPNSFFDSFDLFFQDPVFPRPLGDEGIAAITPNEISIDDLPSFPNDEVISHALEPAPSSTIPAVEPTTAPLPSISDVTRQRFSLDAQDLVASTSREILQRADNVPQYLSPYPEYGGPLGYLPSAPGLHVKCVEVVDERMNFRIESLSHKNRQLTFERNKYKSFFDEFSTVDQATGKPKQKLLQEENAMLRRVSTRHQSRIENYKKEVEEWKCKLNEVATMYNNLLYEIAVQRKLPEVAPPPPKYKPRPVQGVLVPGLPTVSHQPPAVTDPSPELQPPASRGQPARNQAPAIRVSQHSLPGQPPSGTATPSANRPPSRPPGYTAPAPAPANGPSTQAVTIDLTEDDPPAPMSAPNRPPSPATTADRAEALRSLRQKKYHWLEGQSSMSQTRSPPAPVAIGSSGNSTVTIDGPSSQNIDQSDERDVDEDEMARMMEEELAQGS